MDQHQINLSDLPQDIFYYVAKYFDLLDFSAMMLTSKSMFRNLSDDLKLQRLFLENTPRKALHSRAKIPLRVVYLEHVFMRAIKYDNAALVAFALINPSYNTVLARITPMREKNGLLQRQRGPVHRQDVLAKIFEHDANNVLTYIIDICLAEIELPDKFEHLVAVLSLLAEYCFKDGSLSKSTVKSVLSVFKKFEDSLLFSIIYVVSLQTACWGISDVLAADLLAKLLQLQKSFPEFQFNLNKTVSSLTLRRLPSHLPEDVDQVSPLEYAAFLASQKVFSALIEGGAEFDVKKPYLPIALFDRANLPEKLSFIDYLIMLGANIDLPLPSYLDKNRNVLLRYHSNLWDIEYLLAKGARITAITEDEANTLQNDVFLTVRRALLLKAQLSDYNLLKQSPTILPEDLPQLKSKDGMRFINHEGRTLELTSNSKVTALATQFGTWSNCANGTIRIKLTRKFGGYSNLGSYGHRNQTVKIKEPITLFFKVAKSYTNEYVLLPDISTLSDDQKILQMYRFKDPALTD